MANKLRFTLDPNQIRVGTLVLLEDLQAGADRTTRATRDVLAGFLAGEEGDPMAIREARAMLDEMTVAELGDAYAQLLAALQEIKANALPPAHSDS